MADISNRPYSKNYSGLINQSVIAICITGLCVTWHEIARRKRRGKVREEGLGSRESWEFGYLYQSRSWAKNSSPPIKGGWPLSWVKQAVQFPEDRMLQLRGIDATLYTRFLRGCFWFATLHTFTTFLILFPVHVEFSDDSASPRSMTRASIASLVANRKGLNLLWIHMCLLLYITFSWMATLYWISRGVFRMRAQQIGATAEASKCEQSHPSPYSHPHPYWSSFPPTVTAAEKGLRLRTIMVSNIPPSLRTEAELKEYFQFYLARRNDVPSMGLPSTTVPAFLNKFVAFIFNLVRSTPEHHDNQPGAEDIRTDVNIEDPDANKPSIDRVVIARKMTELASLLERREEVLHRLETAHLKLAKRTLGAVQDALDQRKVMSFGKVWTNIPLQKFRCVADVEKCDHDEIDDQMDLLVRTLSPYLPRHRSRGHTQRVKYAMHASHEIQESSPQVSDTESEPDTTRASPPTSRTDGPPRTTIWEALLSLPRSYLDPYQPLVRLSVLFRGKTVPAIDYYTIKLKVLTELITENRSKAATDYDAVSTAFVSFSDPRDARRACKYLAVHPSNPLMCWVTMAPALEDLDWTRVMKSQFKIEFLKEWVVTIGIWAFTLFWLFPVSALIGLVSIQNISAFWPGLKTYLSQHPWQEEVIQSLIPTLLVALLAVLVPLLLFLIAEKAHTIPTLSTLHDVILTRYYKFLIVNVLVFFCVGTALVQAFLKSLGLTNNQQILYTIAATFPTAGPFYVGWLIFTTASHGGFELTLGLTQLPLILYPSTKRQATPRKRALGLQPWTFNYWYWLPNHILVVHILLLFSVFNPLVIPFSMMYFFFESGIFKHQLIHVYSKNYENNGQVLLIRMIRYTLDGLLLTQVVFLAYMVVLEKKANVGVSAVLIVFTTVVKIFMTRTYRAQFERDDLTEAVIICGAENAPGFQASSELSRDIPTPLGEQEQARGKGTWRQPDWLRFSYSTIRPHHPRLRPPNPFGPNPAGIQAWRLGTTSQDGLLVRKTSKQSQSAKAATRANPKVALADFQTQHPLPQTVGPVISHPPPAPWDDQTHIDLPYDNPFYTRSIQDSLWLPRDPLGLLDLDDTVDVCKSITSEPEAGELGTFLGRDHNTGLLQPASASGSPELRHLLRPLPRQYTGIEDIELPLAIAARVQSLAAEEEVEEAYPRRPPLWSRKSSGPRWHSLTNTSRLHIQRPSTFNVDHEPRSASASAALPRSASLLFASGPSGPELGTRPDMHAQADFVRSVLSLAESAGKETSRPQHPSKLSAHEALEMEIQAEEAEALEERLQHEGDEEEVARGRYLWWVPSWMFKSPLPAS